MFFSQVDDVEFDGDTFWGIFHTEEKPLIVSFCVYIILED